MDFSVQRATIASGSERYSPDGGVVDAARIDAINVRLTGARGNGTTDDRAPIQEAIDEVAERGGGIVFLPAATYLISAALTLKRGVTITGVYPGVTPTDGASWDLGFTVATGAILTYPGGTVFTIPTDGGNGTASAIDGVVVERLGFKNVGSIITAGETNKTGLAGSVLRDLWGSAITGVAFDLTNPMHIRGDNLKVSGAAQFLRVTSDYDAATVDHQPGNCYFSDLYCYGSAASANVPSIHLRAIDRNSNGRSLNYIHMTRVQVNRLGHFTTKTGHHLLLEGVNTDVTVNGCTFDGLDLEGYASRRMELAYANKNRIHFVGHANSAQADADYYARNSNLNIVTSTDDNLVMDINDSGSPVIFSGVMTTPSGGARYPLGVWWDKARGGGAQLGMERLAPIDGSTYGVLKLPEASIDFDSGGAVRQNSVSWSTTDTLTLSKTTIGYAEVSTSGSVQVTLPDATLVPRSEQTIKKTGATGTITVATQSSQTIDGASTNTWLDTQYKYLTVISNGTNWLIVAKG